MNDILSDDARWRCICWFFSFLPLVLLVHRMKEFSIKIDLTLIIICLFICLFLCFASRCILGAYLFATSSQVSNYEWRGTFTRIVMCIKYIDWWQGDNNCSLIVITFHTSGMTHTLDHKYIWPSVRADCFGLWFHSLSASALFAVIFSLFLHDSQC